MRVENVELSLRLSECLRQSVRVGFCLGMSFSESLRPCLGKHLGPSLGLDVR